MDLGEFQAEEGAEEEDGQLSVGPERVHVVDIVKARLLHPPFKIRVSGRVLCDVLNTVTTLRKPNQRTTSDRPKVELYLFNTQRP